VDLLLQILPDHSIILLLELDSNTFYSMETKQITALFQLTARARGWSAKDLSRFQATYYNVLVWRQKQLTYSTRRESRCHLSHSVLRGIPPRFPRAKRKTNSKIECETSIFLYRKQASSRTAQDGPLGNVLLPGPQLEDQQSVTDRLSSPTDHNGVSGLRSIGAGMQPRTDVSTQKGTWSGHWGHRGLAWG